ncbi:MAG: DUF885 domain-containing protein [Ornithinimicrobium sp.]|uniref:DUF885 domain-containing protein n=1 Tax=Ornithinimicrobium sp. TaxID=1977084 RepID=UPI003D9ADA57
MSQHETPAPTTPRQLADQYVHACADLDPQVATMLGLREHDDRVPDFSPEAQDAQDALDRRVLADLDALEEQTGPEGWDDLERRCATLLRDRLGVSLECSEVGEHLRPLRNIGAPVHAVRNLFMMMPAESEQDWACIARRMSRFGDSYDSLMAALEEGRRRDLYAAPLQAQTTIDQLGEWLQGEAGGDGSWFHDFVADGPESLREGLTAAADQAAQAVAGLRDYLDTTYLPAAQGTPDPCGEDRYRLSARRWMGADIEPHEVYQWGWAQFRELDEQMREVAEQILPGSTPVEAMRHLDEHGKAVDGVEEVRVYLQKMMDGAIAELDNTHFDIAEPIRTVEARIAPAGSAAAPYYSRPSVDFSRPGRTWLPTLGETRFPLYDLVSTWYHEGVPGHHLQLAQWAYVAPQLSLYQTSLGSSSGATEGWALYAERLMDELGYLDTEERMGYLDCQMMRAIRVVIDLGMHLQLTIPDDSPLAPGQTWTPELATEFFDQHCGRSRSFIESEIVRYLGWPGQAISYKLGERAWLTGREAAQRAHGDDFDLKAWHMAALSLGALGLDDLQAELSRL